MVNDTGDVMHAAVLLSLVRSPSACLSFFFNDTATTEIYTLSLHDALPISGVSSAGGMAGSRPRINRCRRPLAHTRDRKSTRLNSSHLVISYAVFCLKKKNGP